jgi:heterodisulfide reductase subunit C
MAVVISKEKKKAETLIDSVEKISGTNIRECLQCKKCSNGCPVAGITTIGPAEIIRNLQFNNDENLLEKDLVWMCVSCEICYSRCPMKIDMASIMDALRILAVRKKNSSVKGPVHLFNNAFLRTVKLFGRTYDLGMIASYKLGTSSYLQDMDKLPFMLRKRKIAILPPFKGNRTYIKRIFKAKEKEN